MSAPKLGEIWFKGQRVLRTALTTALTILPLIPQVIEIVQGAWSAEWLTGVAIQAVLINSVLTRIIAIPAVDHWLKKIGFGSAPRDADVQDLTKAAAHAVLLEDTRETYRKRIEGE